MKDIEKSDSEQKFDEISYYIPRIAIIVVTALLVLYFINFNNGFGDQATFGAFGDFLGGVLNPILSFLTIVLLIYSIRFQLEELKHTRNEIVRTNEIHSDNLTQQKSMFDITRYVGELDILVERQANIFQQLACKGTKSIGPPQHIAFPREGVHFEWVTSTLLEVVSNIEEYKKYNGDLESERRTESLLKQIFELHLHYRQLLTCLDECGANPSLYKLTSLVADDNFQIVSTFITESQVESFQQYNLK
ncbi:hypothetical protein [Vibrio algivorus]|uniref:Uncharacterized protein n=1 Tax=Vibrio algivorus TaxID=1667024 RepID=A0A557P253_9VIBR|nr:hypothetical protein [Vibrio algivorus]TVO34740.1 hypothetical protein FOF44_13150 [Vibrio algivorus]